MARRLWSILGNSQKLDGGAMFGNAPKAVWQRWCPPDEVNRIDLACRGLLVREEGCAPGGGDRTLLFESGIGAFFEPKLRERYGVVEERHVLLESLETAGFPHDAIDGVVLSHLHFDHAGGLLEPFREGEPLRLLFPRATFVVGRAALERAKAPHPRDRASFIPELPGLLEASGRLEVVEDDRSDFLGEDYRFHVSDGHTPGQLLAEIPGDEGPIVFTGDLVPGRAWVHLPITMGYDRYPERIIDEKTALLTDLRERGGRVFFTHDAEVAMASLEVDGKGRYAPAAERPVLAGESA